MLACKLIILAAAPRLLSGVQTRKGIKKIRLADDLGEEEDELDGMED